MKATIFSRFGAPDVLTVVDIPAPVPGQNEARIRVEAASINPSDVKNVAGAMSQTTLPRIPGRDFAGVVDAGPEAWIGAEVWGSGDAGFTRDGSHAQYIIVPVASLRRKPRALSFDQAASVGVNYLAARRGLVDAAALRHGETLVIIGAGGGVGSAVAQIARRMGAGKIVGVDRSAPEPASAVARTTDAFIAGASDVAAAVRDALGGRGADVVFDAVGGVMFRTALACLAPRGRLIEISATGQREVTFNLADFYHNEDRIIGVDTLKLDLIAAGDILEELRPGFEDGDYQPASIARTFPLTEVAVAYQAVADGQAGRVVLRPQG
ncbi:zinc-binding alcohol dehydrogenase family protein [Bradyrhizobium sp. dw_78]|uniref:quinone oxidoreductase family protein n=1 Tax=Bradyrhizobium sp. dw_78 TaxID=2719793 RepID=UPI001BD5DB2E|nr:zinc-binding alcohol dehydrogenase family protein [Bradyrhizobium sp. dw_78]